MKTLSNFLYALLAGLCISLGGLCYLSLESRLAGALFFSVGLFTTLLFGFHLFTGKVCYIFDNPPRYLLSLPLIWLGNLCGCLLCGYALRLTRLSALVEKAQALSAVKLGDNLLSIFILAFFCNIFIFVAVDGFKNARHDLGRYLALLFGVSCFVLCGLEHCVANMFYFSFAGL